MSLQAELVTFHKLKSFKDVSSGSDGDISCEKTIQWDWLPETLLPLRPLGPGQEVQGWGSWHYVNMSKGVQGCEVDEERGRKCWFDLCSSLCVENDIRKPLS